MTTLFVAVGGVLGVLARWGLTRLTLHSEALIWTTVGINVAGSFLLGLLVAEHWFGRDLREGIGVGFLGGFTTFSTFSVQAILEVDGGARRRRSPTSSLPSSEASPPRRPGIGWAAAWPPAERRAYGSPVAELPDSAKRLISSPALAHLVTLNSDGSPQLSCVWVGLDEDEIVCAHLPRNRKVRNIERDDRVALSIEGEESNEMGLKHHLVVHGTARIVEGGAAELLNRLAQSYIGSGSDFPPMPDPPPGYVTRIAVDRVGGVGPWTG